MADEIMHVAKNSKAYAAFIENKGDIETLWEIHESFAGGGIGKKDSKAEVLNRAVMIMITACWETFVEDLAREAFNIMVDKVEKAESIPSKVRVFAIKKFAEEKNALIAWTLADDGWKNVLQDHKDGVLSKWLGDFNTPKKAQVDSLYEELLGIKNVSQHWFWKKMSKENAAKKLDDFITIRGNIAHRIKHLKNIGKNDGEHFIGHVERLVEKLEESTREHLQGIILGEPW